MNNNNDDFKEGRYSESQDKNDLSGSTLTVIMKN